MAAEGTARPLMSGVDDEPSIRFILEQSFSHAGWAVTCAASEDEPEARLTAASFDVAILDLRLSKDDTEDGGLGMIRHQPNSAEPSDGR
jgi:DNA-binding response OmpR family regulator